MRSQRWKLCVFLTVWIYTKNILHNLDGSSYIKVKIDSWLWRMVGEHPLFITNIWTMILEEQRVGRRCSKLLAKPRLYSNFFLKNWAIKMSLRTGLISSGPLSFPHVCMRWSNPSDKSLPRKIDLATSRRCKSIIHCDKPLCG